MTLTEIKAFTGVNKAIMWLDKNLQKLNYEDLPEPETTTTGAFCFPFATP